MQPTTKTTAEVCLDGQVIPETELTADQLTRELESSEKLDPKARRKRWHEFHRKAPYTPVHNATLAARIADEAKLFGPFARTLDYLLRHTNGEQSAIAVKYNPATKRREPLKKKEAAADLGYTEPTFCRIMDQLETATSGRWDTSFRCCGPRSHCRSRKRRHPANFAWEQWLESYSLRGEEHRQKVEQFRKLQFDLLNDYRQEKQSSKPAEHSSKSDHSRPSENNNLQTSNFDVRNFASPSVRHSEPTPCEIFVEREDVACETDRERSVKPASLYAVKTLRQRLRRRPGLQ